MYPERKKAVVRSPVHPALNAGGLGTGIGDGALHPGNSGVPGVVNLALIYLDLNDLSALVVEVGSNDETLLPAINTMADCDDVAGSNVLIIDGVCN